MVAKQTPEGPVRRMPSIENSPFCTAYQCVISEPVEGKDGDAIWVVLPLTTRTGDALAQRYKGSFFPELTVHIEKNLILFANLAVDTRVRSPMPAATLNLLGNFTRLMLGAPISAQKLSACYRSLETEATCTVGRGTVRVAGVPRRYVAAFRTVDDGAGYSVVNYSIGLED
ncbi:hypothetical protein GCM10008956_13490 [Deinococcus arenae]|uniref:Uncharacterized protein n=1 Tax=Deinococcus arenae TaxID=1452751 RepID=A0A8H9GMY6_9DEIO|nr:hypothetical protein GCM10008956_13490 [Deinococcus arenae]